LTKVDGITSNVDPPTARALLYSKHEDHLLPDKNDAIQDVVSFHDKPE
jgi:hypothetical protein